ncbi:MAG: hypothetical protein M9921_05695 [Fimbriimonadaceae bacterium]|nr:hypothetical protein [Fimbriimonadaceae bacterium]
MRDALNEPNLFGGLAASRRVGVRALARRPERAELVRRTRSEPLGSRATSKLAHSHTWADARLFGPPMFTH